MTLTLIGTGAMSQALALGLNHKHTLEIVGRSQEKAQEFIIKNSLNAKAFALDHFEITDKILLLTVKPYALQNVGAQLQGRAKGLYSILAGSPIQSLKAAIKADYYVRAMPNIAALYGASMTTLTGDTQTQKEALDIFSAIGSTLWLDSEKELDIATALAGSGPAYLALIAEALSDGAVKQGLKRADAMSLTQGLFKGFEALLNKDHPALIKDRVMSPGGTTAAGYTALEKAGVRAAFIQSIEDAYNKTQ